MIGLHSKVTMTNEIDIIPNALMSDYSIDSVFNSDDRKKFIDKLRPRKYEIFHKLENIVKQRFFDEPGDLTINKMVRFTCNDDDKKILFGDKSIIGIFYIDAFNVVFPNALFIYLVRDPRSAIMSKLVKDDISKAHTSPDNTFKKFTSRKKFIRTCVLAERWRVMENIANNAEKKFGRKRWLTIRYEDFVLDPENILANICKWAGLQFEQQMINAEERKKDVVLKTKSGQRYHNLLSADISPDRTSAYKDLSPDLCAIVEKITKDGMKRHGYSILKINIILKTISCMRYFISRNIIRNEFYYFLSKYVGPEYTKKLAKFI
jgi:hypothetical protein